MVRKKFSIAHKDEELWALINTTNHKMLAVWAIDCAQRVLPYFEEKYPEDKRPRKAIETLKEWILTGILKMAVIRKATDPSVADAVVTKERDWQYHRLLKLRNIHH